MMNTNQDTTTKANSQPVNANMSTIEIGTRVRCGEGFAYAFQGQTGTIVSGPKTNCHGERLWTVKLDTATPAAAGWNPIETLAAQAHCYEVIG